jgi:uncharacterized protein
MPELLIQHCPRCGANLHPRRVICPNCGSEELSWVASSGRGVVYSASTIHRAPNPATGAPYHVGIVALEEGVHLFTRFLSDNGRAPEIDDPVSVRFETQRGGRELPMFAVEKR